MIPGAPHHSSSMILSRSSRHTLSFAILKSFHSWRMWPLTQHSHSGMQCMGRLPARQERCCMLRLDKPKWLVLGAGSP